MGNLRYLSYIIRHKWFVSIECVRLGIPWRGITHDLSKFLPSEWIAYKQHFYGPIETWGEFDLAWFKHQNRNDHHWQWWILRNDSGSIKSIAMSHAARRDMLADWKGAGRALGKPDTAAWYEANKHNMVLHPETREWVEKQLGN